MLFSAASPVGAVLPARGHEQATAASGPNQVLASAEHQLLPRLRRRRVSTLIVALWRA